MPSLTLKIKIEIFCVDNTTQKIVSQMFAHESAMEFSATSGFLFMKLLTITELVDLDKRKNAS